MTLRRCAVATRRAILGTILLSPFFRWCAASAATIREGREVVLPDASGRRRWAAWVERGRMGRTVALVLRTAAPEGGRQLWSDRWPDAYEPALRVISDWRHGGRPLVALTMRYGAGAQEAVLVADGGTGSPRRVAERLASAIEWRQDARGCTVLVAFGRDGSALVPECLSWDGHALMTIGCQASSLLAAPSEG